MAPGIGAFVGFVLGALIGNLFGRKKPRIPTANAEVYLDYTSDKFQLGASSAANGGNLELVRSMAMSARDTLNGFLVQLAGDYDYDTATGYRYVYRNNKGVETISGSQSTFYGHTAGQLWVKFGSSNGTQNNVTSADEAVSRGVMWALDQTQVVGGDIFAKRALANSPATDLTSLLGDLQIAADYRFYANNRELINGYITGAYATLQENEKGFYEAYKSMVDRLHTQGIQALNADEQNLYNQHKPAVDRIIQALEDQSIANPWIITLQRISELKLDQWSASDFNGGLQGFLMSFGLEQQGAYFEDVKIAAQAGGAVLGIDSDTAQDGIFSLLPQAMDGPMNNDVVNPRWQQGLAGWEAVSSFTGDTGWGVNLNADWSGNGNDVLYAAMGGVPPVGSVFDTRSDWLVSRGGVTYEASVMAAQHRGYAQLFVEFFDENKNWLNTQLIPGTAREYGAGQGSLANFDRISGQVVSPSGTAYRRIALRLGANGSSDPYAFFTQPGSREITNDVPNPRWQNGLLDWEMSNYLTTAPARGVNLSPEWSGSGNDVFWSHMGGTPPVGAIVDNRSDFIRTEGGLTYEFSVLAAQHRGVASAYVEFFDADKRQIGSDGLNGEGKVYGAQYGNPANFDRLSAQITAPQETVYRRLVLRLHANGGEVPYAFFTQPESRVIASQAYDWEGRGNSLRIDDLSKIGYSRSDELNSAGKDLIDRSGMTTGVVIEDYRTETRIEGRWVWTGQGQEPGLTHYDPSGDPNYYYVEEEVTYAISGGDDIFIGGQGNDFLRGHAGADWLNGNAGDDSLEGGDGDDVLIGGEGRDSLFGGNGDDYIVGGAGDDNPWISGRHAGMWGGEGNDIIVFNGGTDAGFGENGDDIFLMEQDGFLPGFEASGHYDGNQMDYVDAGAGSDTISYERFTEPFAHNLDVNFWPWATNASAMPVGGINGVAVYLGNHPNSWNHGDAYWADARYVMGDWIKGVENVTGSRLNDYLWGDAGDNILKGGAGDDFLDGQQGNDTFEGGAGADYMVAPGEGTLSYEGSTAGVFIDMTTGEAFGGHATGDQWVAMDHLTGSRFSDELKGDAGSNRITGLGGDDWIVATVGGDIYDGGDGLDTVDYSGANEGVNVHVNSAYQGEVGTGNGHGGLAYGHSYIGIEAVLGSTHADYLSGGYGAQEFMGGKGNDTLAGGEGSDVYYFERGDGFDQIVEDNTGSNTLSFGADIKAGDLSFGWQSHANGVFEIGLVQNSNDKVRIQGNVQEVGNNRLKTIDLNGAGQIDVSALERLRTGYNTDDSFSGEQNLADLIAGYQGNDTMYGATANRWESKGNVFIGGGGADYMSASVGDDQYVFDKGDSYDTIVDGGGEDTLVFGATVQSDDVRVEVQGGDLVVFYNPDDGSDHVRVHNGAIREVDVYSGTTNTPYAVEFINAGGTWIDIRKLDIAWVDQQVNNSGWAPIVLDLAADGLDLTGVDDSMVVSKLETGQLTRMGWVGPTDGMLAMDRNGDGKIDRLSEISFVADKEGAKTDLEGLRAWDSNGDGKLSVLDKDWGQFKVWVDRNQNGRSTTSELRTLTEAGITELDLTGKATGYTADLTRDNFVHNTLDFTWSDGTKGTGYDVVLGRKLLEEKGLSADQVKAAWGKRNADGELGRLKNDPVADATAIAAGALAAADMGLRSMRSDKVALRRPDVASSLALSLGGDMDMIDLGLTQAAPIENSTRAKPTLDEILARAEVDFSDNDLLDVEEEARWADRLTGRKDDPNQKVETDRSVKGSDSTAETVRGAFGRNFAAPDLTPEEEAALEEVSMVSVSAGGSLGTGEQSRVRVNEADLSPVRTSAPDTSDASSDLDAAASLLSGSTGAEDAWSSAPVTLADLRGQGAWWMQGGQALTGDNRAWVPDLTRDETADQTLAPSTTASDTISSDRQKLLQAMAGFGKDKGAAAAVWNRTGETLTPDTLSAQRTLPNTAPTQTMAA